MKALDPCPRLYFGKDGLRHLKYIQTMKTFVVADPFIVDTGVISRVYELFEGRSGMVKVFSGVEPDPSVETVCEGLREMLAFEPEAVVGFGGGSAIDAAKAMIYFYAKMGAKLGRADWKKPLFAAVPTTSGTGSEVTSYAVVTDRKNKVKIPLSDSVMVPDAVVLDPEFTKTLPKEIIANTGMDVLTHAMEAYVSPASNYFTEVFAKEAARTVFTSLVPLYNNREDEELRGKMHAASAMAGLAFNNAGLGLNHGIAHTLGAEYKIPHGMANSIVMPYVIAFNGGFTPYQEENTRGRYAELARVMGLSAGNDTEACRALIYGVEMLNRKLNIPASLTARGVNEKEFAGSVGAMADKILNDRCTQANPVRVTKEALMMLLMDICAGSLNV